MGVYYAFSPEINYKKVKEFLEFEKLEHCKSKVIMMNLQSHSFFN